MASLILNGMSVLELQGIIAAELLQPFVWGECDCCLAVANILVTLGFADVAAKWRGTYSSALIMRRPIGKYIEDSVAESGWPEVDQPHPACIGFEREGRIYDGTYWWGKTKSGMGLATRPARIWRPICRLC